MNCLVTLPGRALLVLVIAGAATVIEAKEPAAVEAVIDQVVVPGFERFAEQSETLTAASMALCVQTQVARLRAAQEQWGVTAVGWNALLAFRFGPMKEGFPAAWEWQIDSNLIPGGTRHKVIRAALNQAVEGDSSITSATIGQQKLFTRGLHAIETVLFENSQGKRSDELVLASFRGDHGARKCAYLVALAEFNQSVAQQLSQSWASREFARSGAAAKQASAPLTDELLNQSIAMLDYITRNKVLVVLGDQPAAADRAEAAASGYSTALIRANLRSIDSIFRPELPGAASGLAELLRQYSQTDLLEAYESQFRAAMVTLDRIGDSLTSTALQDPELIEQLAAELNILRNLLRLEITQALNVNPAFTETDGD